MCPYPLYVSDHSIQGPFHLDLNNHSKTQCNKCANTRGFREILRARPFPQRGGFSPVEANHSDSIW